MTALRVFNLRNLVDVGVLLGRVSYEKHGVVAGEGGLAKLVEKLYYSINEQQLDSQVANQLYDAKGRLEKKYGYGNKTLEFEDEQELKRNSRVWMELIAKSVAARVAFESSKPIILNAESLTHAATNYSNPFFDGKVWDSLTDVAKNDFKETTRCFMAGAWTAAAMTALRGAEAVLRQYSEFKTGAKSGGKPWGT